MPVTFQSVALAVSFCALTLPGVTTPAFAQAGVPASERAFAATGSISGPSVTIGNATYPLATGQLSLASGPTQGCSAAGCAHVGNATTHKNITTQYGPQQASLESAAFGEVLSGLRGAGAPATVDLASHGGAIQLDDLQVDIVLDEATLTLMDPAISTSLRADLTELATKIEPLATAAGPGPIADLLTTVRDLSKDLGSRPFMRITQDASSVALDAKPGGTLTSGQATITVMPTDGGAGLIEVHLNAGTMTAQALSGQSATGQIEPGLMRVSLLPGLIAALPATVGTQEELVGTPVAQVLAQLPKAASGILGPNFAATDSALVLDQASGGLTMDVTPSTERACWFDSTVFESCVESSVGQRKSAHDGLGMGIVGQPARLGTLRQNLILRLHEASLGVNSDGKAAAHTPVTRQDQQAPLPKTGADLPPVWALGLMALASIGVLTLVPPKRGRQWG